MLKDDTVRCEGCGAPRQRQAIYRHRNRMLCEDCCLDARLSPARKTHWQYIGSVKTDCLRDRGEA